MKDSTNRSRNSCARRDAWRRRPETGRGRSAPTAGICPSGRIRTTRGGALRATACVASWRNWWGSRGRAGTALDAGRAAQLLTQSGYRDIELVFRVVVVGGETEHRPYPLRVHVDHRVVATRDAGVDPPRPQPQLERFRVRPLGGDGDDGAALAAPIHDPHAGECREALAQHGGERPRPLVSHGADGLRIARGGAQAEHQGAGRFPLLEPPGAV